MKHEIQETAADAEDGNPAAGCGVNMMDRNKDYNAGAGWEAKGSGDPPGKYAPNRERDSELRLDQIFKDDKP